MLRGKELHLRIWLPWLILATCLVVAAVANLLWPGEGNIRSNRSQQFLSPPEQTLDQTSQAKNVPSLEQPEHNVSFVEARPDSTVWLVITIAFLSATTALSVGISFYLYRWRRLLLDREEILVPEAWGKRLLDFNKSINTLIETFGRNTNLLENASENNTATLNTMVETFMTFRTAIDERDREIRRLKGGYDKEIFARFLKRFIRVHQTLENLKTSEDEGDQGLEMLSRLLEDALDDCGLEIFEPKLGEDYRRIEGIADNPLWEPTTEPDKEFTIAEVIEKGYRLPGGERSDVIVPAKVKILVRK